MAYRDDTEALRAHIERLEGENADLQRELARLRGELDGSHGTLERILGAPLVLRVERTLEGEMSPEDRSRLIASLRSSLGPPGSVLQLGRTFVFRTKRSMAQRGNNSCAPRAAPYTQVTIKSENGKTKITLVEHRGTAASGVFAGVLGGVGGGGMGMVLPLSIVASPFLPLLTVPLWWLAAFGLARTTFALAGRARARKLEAAASAVESVLREAIAAREAKRGPAVRVAAESSDEESTDEAEIGAVAPRAATAREK